MFCRECGKQIEADARFCRFCGRPQVDPSTGFVSGGSAPPAASAGLPDPTSSAPSGSPDPSRGRSSPGLESRLRDIFPRHHLQDEFMHIGSIVAFVMAVIGFILGFVYAYAWLGTNFLLGSVALLLFLILRESTLSHIRVRGGHSSSQGSTRYHAARQPASPAAAEAATAESSPPASPVR